MVGVGRVTSTSRENGGSITVEIETDEDIDVMLTEVINAVDRVPNFPTGMELLVVAKQENIRETFDYFVSGENVDLATLKQIARQMEYDLRAMDRLSQIEIEGCPEEEIEIAVGENNLLAYNLTFAEVAEAVSRANILTTGGSIKTEAEDFLIRADNRSYYGKELNNLVVKFQPDGTLVTLRDVATIRDRFSETPNASYINGRVAVSVNISTTNNEDLMAAAEKVRQYVKEFNEKNDTIEIIVEHDRSITLSQRTDLDRNFEVDALVDFTSQIQLEKYVNSADANNVSLLQAEKNIIISDYHYKASKVVFLLSIGLTGSYGWNEGNFPVTSFATSITTTGVFGGVSLRWDLFDGGRGITTTKNAKIQYDNQQLAKEQIKKEVTRDIFNARGNYQNRLEVLDLQTKNISTAKNNFERSSEQYKLGQITSVELRQAQANLLNAQTSKNLDKYDAKLAELELLQLTGQLLNIEF